MTFSITARCSRTNQFGVAVSTAVPAVGSLCPFPKANVGAIATQAFVNPYIGVNGLKLLTKGLSAKETLAKVLADDPLPGYRQVAIVDKNGQTAAFTGENCDSWDGHIEGDGFVVAGNMLVGGETIQAMAKAFEENPNLDLSERLLVALEAGQAAGGDKRGRQSAALHVVGEEDYPVSDLRVDEHTDPVKELRRVYTVAAKQLTPLLKKLPTKAEPAGKFHLFKTRDYGLSQDNN